MAIIHPTLRSVYGTATTAEVTAGHIVIPAAAGRQYTVTDAWVKAAGTAAGATSVDLTDETTIVAIFTAAGLVDATLLRAGTATTGVAANLLTALADDTPLYLKKVGAALTTTTAIEYMVDYVVTSTNA